MSVKLIPEVLDEVAACETREQAIEVLRKNNSPALRIIIQYIYFSGLYPRMFDVSIPNWKENPNPIGLSPNSLFIEARRIYIFTISRTLPPETKTELLLNILESVHPSEAKLLVNIICRNVNYKNLTYDVINEAIPGLLPIDEQMH